MQDWKIKCFTEIFRIFQRHLFCTFKTQMMQFSWMQDITLVSKAHHILYSRCDTLIFHLGSQLWILYRNPELFPCWRMFFFVETLNHPLSSPRSMILILQREREAKHNLRENIFIYLCIRNIWCFPPVLLMPAPISSVSLLAHNDQHWQRIQLRVREEVISTIFNIKSHNNDQQLQRLKQWNSANSSDANCNVDSMQKYKASVIPATRVIWNNLLWRQQ